MLGKRILNFVVSLAVGVAEVLGMKLKVELSEHRINLSLVEPEKLTKRAYDSNHYENGNVFIEGFANPVKVKLDDARDELELIASERYKHFMKMTLLKDLIRSTEGNGWTLEKMVQLLIALTIVNIGLVGFFLFLIVGA